MTVRATMRFLLALVALALLTVAPASAQTQAILPNGMTQFSDGNGAPSAPAEFQGEVGNEGPAALALGAGLGVEPA